MPVSPHSAEIVAVAWSRDSRFVASFDRDGFFAMTDRDGRVHLHVQVHAGASHIAARVWVDDATRHAVVADELSFVVISAPDVVLGAGPSLVAPAHPSTAPVTAHKLTHVHRIWRP